MNNRILAIAFLLSFVACDALSVKHRNWQPVPQNQLGFTYAGQPTPPQGPYRAGLNPSTVLPSLSLQAHRWPTPELQEAHDPPTLSPPRWMACLSSESLERAWQIVFHEVPLRDRKEAFATWVERLYLLKERWQLSREEIATWVERFQVADLDVATKFSLLDRFSHYFGIPKVSLPFDPGIFTSESDFWRAMLQNDVSILGRSLNLGEHFSLRPQIDEKNVTVGFFITPQEADAPTLFLKTLKERGRDEARHLHWVKLWFEKVLAQKKMRAGDSPIAKVALPLDVFSYEVKGPTHYAALFPVAPGKSLSFYRRSYCSSKSTDEEKALAKKAFSQVAIQLRRFHEVFGVPHGDFYGQNVFYAPSADGGPGQVTLIDPETFAWSIVAEKDLSAETKVRRRNYMPKRHVLADVALFLRHYAEIYHYLEIKALVDFFIDEYLSVITDRDVRDQARDYLNQFLD